MQFCRNLKRQLAFSHARMKWHAATIAASALMLEACSASPSRNILGSYFPSWMICALLGLVGVAVMRTLLGKAGIDAALPMPVVVYLCAWVAMTLAIWLVWLA